MNTQAYFEDIQYHIIEELKKAKQSVFVAIAWFTDKKLFRELLHKSKEGVKVELILLEDEINQQSMIQYDELSDFGGKVWKISPSKNMIMHNKYCIIDKETVISGSYNWTNKAKQNHESITIIRDNELALQFDKEFCAIKTTYFGEQNEVVDYHKICIRLDTLKNVIVLEDEEDIAFQLQKIKQLSNSSVEELQDIIDFIHQKQFRNAILCIEEFVTKYRSVTIYLDYEIEGIRLEIKALGLQISSLEDEKAEIEKTLYTYHLRHDRELGELILRILELRKEKLKEEALNDANKRQEAEEAEEDYQNYNQSFNESKNKKQNILNQDEEKDLKRMFRDASKLCHPDVVDERQEKEANAIFHRLRDAYEANDIETVSQILSDLQKGILESKGIEISEKQKLLKTLEKLRRNRDLLAIDLNILKKSKTYKMILNITDWNEYFATIKKQLEEELAILEGKE